MLLLGYLDDIERYKELKAKGDTKGMKEPKKRNYIGESQVWMKEKAERRSADRTMFSFLSNSTYRRSQKVSSFQSQEG